MNVDHILKNPSIAHHEILKTICNPLEKLGVNFFGYTAVNASGEAFCLGSRPEYASEYLRLNHAQNDVHYHNTQENNKFEYSFWDYLEKDCHTQALYQMAALFNQSHTLTITAHAPEMTHCYHFSAPLNQSGINQIYLEKMDSLHAFIDYFSHCMKAIPELAAVYNLPANIDIDHNAAGRKVIPVKANPRTIELEEVAQNSFEWLNGHNYYLTAKERELLQWIRLGKSAELIADIKGISRKTVERHVASIKDKFECYTMYQLGEKIASSGLAEFLSLYDSKNKAVDRLFATN
ncbi:putative transcriptional regulator [Legionella birminghamensis]|uniref:Transcriptional regulator n=1 Tax=Legionella birminghamensis TaxID=28083 RepID=A0A378I928_9GAMM|nr:helix-turn-helix transcriptional regulator [Legionella birminghamensis]KTC69271.1 putative transcriptional regulator [Legionella birminghamensis]STX31533.1 LuxR family transcriptional regulatory, chaperone HchA-associated [Legionella birminghamensis]